MKYKKIVSGLLACAMVVTSVFTGNVTTAKAAGEAMPTPVATYDFNAAEGTVSPTEGTLKENVEMYGKAFAAYSGGAKYGPGRNSDTDPSDFSIQTGDYGLKLPDGPLGENYTVSLWVKPTAGVDFASSVVFVGSHDPAKWISVAGVDSSDNMMCWISTGNTNKGNTKITLNEWNMITLVQEGTNAKVFVNGTDMKIDGKDIPQGMVDAGQYIALGLNNWDNIVKGYYDDVNLYNQALTPEQVKALYEGISTEDTPETIFDKKGFTATDSFYMMKGEKKPIEVNLPYGVAESDVAEKTFTANKEGVVTISEAGEVTAAATGTVEITTSIKVGNVTKTATTSVKVREEGLDKLTPVKTLDFNNEQLPEDVAIINAANAEFEAGAVPTPVFEAGRTGDAADKSVKLGTYALRLPGNIGSNYTVSVWVKSNQAKIGRNKAIFLLGNGPEPQEWLGFAGKDAEGKAKLWSASATMGYTNARAEFAEPKMVKDEWTMLTLAQDGTTLKIYQDGELLNTETGVGKMLDGENQKILLGATYWNGDGLFDGWVDDVNVYNETLTDYEVSKLFDSSSEEDIFKKKKFEVHPSKLNLVAGKEPKDIVVKLPAGVKQESATVTFTSNNTSFATVSQTGTVTGVAEGATTVTVSVTVGETTLEKEVSIDVIDPASIDQEVAADYDFSGAVDGKLVDISNHGNDAAIQDLDCVEFTEVADDEDYMTFIGGENDGYVELPMSIMDDLTDKEQFTIEARFAKSADCGTNAWLYCFGSKPQKTGTNYMFLSPNFDGKTLRAGIKNSSVEKLFGTSMQPAVDQWYTVNMVFNKGTVKLYVNGKMIKGDKGNELKSDYSIMDDVITPGTQDGILGFIGKSCWSADKNYKGKISRFTVYNKAMTDEEVQTSDPAYQEEFEKELEDGLKVTDILGKNASAAEVRYNLSLPSTFNEVDLKWESLSKDVITDKGVVTSGTTDQNVKLKATATSGALTASVELEVTVKPVDKTKLQEAINNANVKMADPNYAQSSKDELQKLIDKGNTISKQSEVDSLVRDINNFVNKLDYSDLYKDPFTAIDDSKLVKANLTVAPKATASVLNAGIPASIKDMVTVTYKSNKTSIATVDPNTGKVTAKSKVGYAVITTTVTAKYDSFAMEYQTVVKVDLDLKSSKNGVTAKASATSLAKGKTTTVKVTYKGASKTAKSKGVKATVTYRATGAVSVSKTGKITAKKAGTGKVYVKVAMAGKNITKTLTVKVGEITGASSVKVKKSITLKVKGLSGKVTWKVDKTKLAKISSKGKLTAKKAGKVKVTAKVGKVTMTKTITIKKK